MAIAYIESMLRASPDPVDDLDRVDIWEELRKQNASVELAVKFFRDHLDGELALNEYSDREIVQSARRQVDHPDFAKYVAGNLGAM